MAGIIDWNKLCNKVAEAFQKAIWDDIYTAFAGAVANSPYNDSYQTSGSVDEDEFIAMINHVEAATGKTARVLGTQAALKKLAAATTTNFVAASEKEDIYNQGYIGKFYGTDCYKLQQRHAAGTDNFLFDDNVLYVIASDDQFIKFVTEGDTIVDDREWTQNSDMTIEYRMFERWGVGVAVAPKSIAKYTIA